MPAKGGVPDHARVRRFRRRSARWSFPGPDGAGEVPVRATEATGRACFELAEDGQAIAYRLEVDDITNVVQAHIRVSARTTNGPVLFLYGPVPARGGPMEGEIARGTIRPSSLIAPFAGQRRSRLLDAIARHSAYVDIHTNAGIAGAPPTAGDFPGGRDPRPARRREALTAPSLGEPTNTKDTTRHEGNL